MLELQEVCNAALNDLIYHGVESLVINGFSGSKAELLAGM